MRMKSYGLKVVINLLMNKIVIGLKMWIITQGKILPYLVAEYYPEDNEIYGTVHYRNYTDNRVKMGEGDIHKNIFFNKEEAEKWLKENS